MIDLEPFKEVMQKNILYIIGVGILLIIGNLLFKKLEKKLRNKSKRQ